MSTELQTQIKPAPKPSLTSAPSGLLQSKCACGGSSSTTGECEECDKKRLTLQRYPANQPGALTLLRSIAEISHFDSRATIEPGFGHSFSRVQVHNRAPERIQTKLTINEPGDQYEQEVDHVAEQVTHTLLPPVSGGEEIPPLSRTETQVQRMPINEAAASPEVTPTPEPISPEATPSAGLIVEDEASELEPGQMRKTEFLDELQSAVCATADAELATVGQTAQGCPYIERWIGYYRTRDSQHVERALRRYAPEAAGVRTARDYIPLVSDRVRSGVARWATTGEITEVPEELVSQVFGGGLLGAVGGFLSGVAGAVSSVVSGIGSIFTKAREGGAREADPQAIQSQLGSGQSLDRGVRSRMESAFGMNFSHVRVHTDTTASGFSDNLNARAFTVGEHVAFGAGEYQPGTLIGDALIAHELAHVVQQGGGSASLAPMEQESTVYNALEEDADLSAVGAVASLWGGAEGKLKDIAQNAMPRLRSGLRLSRCPDKSPTKATSLPKKTVSVHINHLEKGPTSHASDLSKAQETYAVANVDIKEVKSATFDDAKTKSLIGNDYILDEFTTVGTPTDEEKKLTLEADGRTTGAISVYYVKSLSHGSTGESFWPKDWPTISASVVISSTDTKETFSHELGHVLLDDGGHHADNNNLMFQPNFKFGLDEEQRKTIYNSPFAK